MMGACGITPLTCRHELMWATAVAIPNVAVPRAAPFEAWFDVIVVVTRQQYEAFRKAFRNASRKASRRQGAAAACRSITCDKGFATKALRQMLCERLCASLCERRCYCPYKTNKNSNKE